MTSISSGGADGEREGDGGADGSPVATSTFTSVIYVHGIGSQRRYEETSTLIDSLDRHAFNEHARGESKGWLGNIKVRVEPLRGTANGDLVGYIRTFFSGPADASGATRRTVRFYENYWAPIMAEVKSPWDVLRWLFRQPFRPRHTAFSPWRERQRLRRASLVSMFEPGHTMVSGLEPQDCGRMIKLYDDFEGLRAQRDYPRGKFDDFLRFIEDEDEGRPDRTKRHLSLARLWRRRYFLEEARNLFVLVTMALALALCALGTIAGTYMLLRALASWLAEPLHRYDIPFDVTWKSAAAVVVSLAGLLKLGKVVTDYLGDVEAWATYEETEVKNLARRKVLDQSVELFTHVLNDERCDRVVVVSHSLGTSIAQDTILALTRRNRAADINDPLRAVVRLDKIDQFVTMGSPIDKIEYFFESYSSRSHRYKRVVEELRGDIGSVPFSDGRHIPRIHWINFWDEGDPISGPLQSPASGTSDRHRVDNVEVASVAFPDPAASHAGYFGNGLVISRLFEIIYGREHSFWPAPKNAETEPQARGDRHLGPGAGISGRRAWFAVVLSLPWLVLVGALARFSGWAFGTWLLAAAAAGLVASGLGFWTSKRAGQRSPI